MFLYILFIFELIYASTVLYTFIFSNEKRVWDYVSKGLMEGFINFLSLEKFLKHIACLFF